MHLRAVALLARQLERWLEEVDVEPGALVQALEFPRDRLRHLGRDGRRVDSQRSRGQLRPAPGRKHGQHRCPGRAPAGKLN
jgi:hypothetical protein